MLKHRSKSIWESTVQHALDIKQYETFSKIQYIAQPAMSTFVQVIVQVRSPLALLTRA